MCMKFCGLSLVMSFLATTVFAGIDPGPVVTEVPCPESAVIQTDPCPQPTVQTATVLVPETRKVPATVMVDQTVMVPKTVPVVSPPVQTTCVEQVATACTTEATTACVETKTRRKGVLRRAIEAIRDGAHARRESFASSRGDRIVTQTLAACATPVASVPAVAPTLAPVPPLGLSAE